MPHIKIKLSVILFLCIGLTATFAQKSILASGGNISGSGGSVGYSVGQFVYTTLSGTNGSVAQGIQQPYEISVVLGVENAKMINLVFSVYPNPATDYVKLKVDNYKLENLNYQLYDTNTKLLESKKVSGNETLISLENLVPAVYFIKVIQNNNEVKIFKIIKN